MNLSIDSFQVDKKPNVDCSRLKPFICDFRAESQTALIFYLKFANINFPRVCKGRRMENNSVRVIKTWGVFVF